MKKIYTVVFALIMCVKIYAQVPGAWDFAYDISEVRNGHTATFVNDTTFLVTGGFNGTENLNTAEVYDYVTDSWTTTGEMDSIRFQHTATALPNGKVLIAGGWDGGYLNYYGTQIYDPITGSFSAGPFMHAGRSGHTATRLNNGKILLVGGYSNENGNTDVVDLYDPVTDSMTEVASLHYGRSYHCAVLLSDGRVLVAGGYNPDYGYQMNNTEIYDPVADTWTDAADMSTARDYFGMTAIPESSFSLSGAIAAGGRYFNGAGYDGLQSVEKYNPESDSWSEITEMPEGQSYMQIFYFSFLTDGGFVPCILVPGSTGESGGGDLIFSHSYAYSFLSGDWSSTPMFTDGRYLYAGDYISNDADYFRPILITGGFDKIAEIFYPAVDVAIPGCEANTFALSPNPVNDVMLVQMQANSVVQAYTIYNAAGEKIIMATVNTTAPLSIPVTGLPQGMYLLVLDKGDSSKARAFFVKN